MVVKIKDYFDVRYGINLELVDLKQATIGINFVSRTFQNNGVSAIVEPLKNVSPNPANTISVSCGGSVMESFLQKEKYYSGRDVYYLKPKIALTDKQLLFYCMCLRANKYRYNFGRQANKTLSDIPIPSINEIPKWVELSKLPKVPEKTACIYEKIELTTKSWKTFLYKDVFVIKKGYYNKKPPRSEVHEIPFIGATDKNNGVTSYHLLKDILNYSRNGEIDRNDERRIFDSNCITISNNGSVGYAFYQARDFTCSHDVNPVYLKDYQMNAFIALFLCTVVGLDRYRWSFGRKWRPKRMPNSEIRLPVTNEGKPDWKFMEDFIKTLPYSKSIEGV